MKICLINNLYKPFQRGGAERVSEILLEGFKDSGCDVFVVTTKPYFKKLRILETNTKIYWINSLYLNLKVLPFLIRLFWHFFDMLDVFVCLKVKKIINKEKPDLIITANLMGLSFLLPELFAKKKLNHVHILHDIQLLHPSGLMMWKGEGVLNSVFARLYQKINSILFKNVKNVISPSNWLLEEHSKRGFFRETKKHMLLNPVPYKEREEKKKKEKLFTFLFVGHLTEAKGVNVLLKAYVKLKKEFNISSINLVLAGKNSLNENNRKIVNDLNITVTGFIDNDIIKNLMLSSDLLIVPSLCYENSPTVIYEAVLYDLPFVTSDLGGATELAKLFGGQIFEPGNCDELAKCMIDAIEEMSSKEELLKINNEKLKNYQVSEYIENILKIVS